MESRIWRFNRGEWTEAYVFLKLLSEGKIYGATEDFKKDITKFIKIISVIRPEKEDFVLKYDTDFASDNPSVSAFLNEIEFAVITVPELSEKAEFLYSRLRTVSRGNAFDISEIQTFLERLRFSSPKLPKLPKTFEDKFGKKTDIIVTIINSEDSSLSTDGFSIKSHLGQPSSLFNSGDGSRLIYRINGCTERRMYEINSIESETGIIEAIRDDKRLSLDFVRTGKEEFAANLEFIDTKMIGALSTALLCQTHYLDAPESNNMRDIVRVVAEYNPLKVRSPQHFYEAKFKSFLFASLAGLTASKPWDGKTRMTGGYIDVNKDGDLLYYRAISDEVFCSYLYENTYIDRPSRGVNKDIAIAEANAALKGKKLSDSELRQISMKDDGKMKAKKGDWGYVYQENGDYFIAINFQVRFR